MYGVCMYALQNTQFKERWAEEAAMLYDRATTMSLPNSLLLHFAYADFEEVLSCELVIARQVSWS